MRWGSSIAALMALSACGQQPATQPKNEAAPRVEASAEPAPAVPANASAPAGDLNAYLAGAWTYENDCSTDFLVHYNADGSLDNSGNRGRWKVDGNTVTETITERVDLSDEPEKVSPPEVLSYMLTRVDDKHAVLTVRGKAVPILRC